MTRGGRREPSTLARIAAERFVVTNARLVPLVATIRSGDNLQNAFIPGR